MSPGRSRSAVLPGFFRHAWLRRSDGVLIDQSSGPPDGGWAFAKRRDLLHRGCCVVVEQRLPWRWVDFRRSFVRLLRRPVVAAGRGAGRPDVEAGSPKETAGRQGRFIPTVETARAVSAGPPCMPGLRSGAVAQGKKPDIHTSKRPNWPSPATPSKPTCCECVDNRYTISYRACIDRVDV